MDKENNASSKNFVAGVDIGGTKCAVVISRIDTLENEQENVFSSRICFETPSDKSALEVLTMLGDGIDSLLSEASADKNSLASIGISCGSPLDSRRGIIMNPPNLLGWDNIPVTSIFENRFGTPAFLQNDANACALAEWKFGAARGTKNAIFLTFGTGMGAGLILNGRLYSGSNDMAGEIGHVRIAPNGPVGYGKSGSFEGFCSGNGLAQLARIKVLEKLQVGIHPSFCAGIEQLDLLDAKIVAEAADRGDALAKEIYAECARYLGRGLAILIDILNPEIIVIGSIFQRSEELFYPYVTEVLEQEALSANLNSCRIVPAKLGNSLGDHAAISVALDGLRGAL